MKPIQGPISHRAFFKYCELILVKWLCFLFNLSVNLGKFPDLWKSDSKNVVENYQPITVICNYSKVSEILSHEILLFLYRHSS